MWPQILDLTKDECKKMLRRLELEAYYSIITAFRAQGDLTKEKKKVLQDLCNLLGISTERHRAEIRRAVNDEKLNTIADQIAGCSKSSEWAIEGRRLIPLMPRLVPQTAFTAFANNAANMAAAQNASMPPPSATSNKHENIHASSDVEMIPLKPTSGNKPGCIAKQFPSSASHITQTHSFPQLQSEIKLAGSLDKFAEEVENQLYSVQESQTTNATSGNVVMLPGGMSVHVKGNIEGLNDDDKSWRRKRSSSVDTPNIPQKVATSAKSSAVQRTVSIPIGASPVQVTGTVTTSGQKVILVSTSCGNLPSSILQRTLGGQVKTVSTVASASQSQSKPSLAPPISNSSNTSTPPCTPRQKGKGPAVPVTTQPSTATAHTQTLQIRPGTTITKPTFQFKEGTGLKIIAQAVPMSSGGTKMIAKPSSSGSASPIVVVTKTASLAPGIQSGTRVVNVITTQASSGKVLMPTSFSVAKSAGSSALVTVGAKGRQTALVKVAPTMSLTSQGGKPNLFVVQKAHLSSLSSGNAVPLPASVTACAQTVLRPNSESSQDEKTNQIEMKSTVLADLLQAAGILPDGASADIRTIEITEQTDSGEELKVKDHVQAQVPEVPTVDEQWMAIADQTISEEVQVRQEQQAIYPPTQDSADELRKTSSSHQQNLPLMVQDSNNLEMQEHSNINETAKLTMLAMDLLKKAGLNAGSKITDKGQASIEENSSKSSCLANSEQCHMPCSSGQATLGENGELDPTTGIFYPYPSTAQEEPNLGESSTSGAFQSLQQSGTAEQNVLLDFPVFKIEADQSESIADPENSANSCGAPQVILKQAKDEDSKHSINIMVPVSMENGPPVAFKQEIDTGGKKADDVSTFINEHSSSGVTIKSEVKDKEAENIEHKGGVKILLPPTSSQSLYRGVTYSKEDAVARKKTMQSNKLEPENADAIKPTDVLGDLQANSPSTTVSVQENANPEDSNVLTDEEVVEEILECEEVHFTDDNIITGIIEETVVTMDESEHCVIMEQNQSSFNPGTNELVKDEIVVGEITSDVHCLPTCKQEDGSVTLSSAIEFEPVAFSGVQVSIKDVLASSKSQSSGSSIFMVTDSVVETDPINLPLVVPLPDDIVAVEHIELSEESSEKIPIAEVTVHDDGSTSYVVRQQNENESTYDSSKNAIQFDSVKEENDLASSSSAGSAKGTGKRKRKPSTHRASTVEENPSTAHLSGWARSAMGLLLRVMKFRGSRRMKGEPGASHWFLHPVTEEEAPGYHQVVKYPMDFSAVKKKLESGGYQDVSEFNQDMNLVKINCDIYNPPQHEARLDGEEVFQFYNQEYDKLIEKWQKTHLFSPNQKKLKFA